jgi:hypothetical protein
MVQDETLEEALAAGVLVVAGVVLEVEFDILGVQAGGVVIVGGDGRCACRHASPCRVARYDGCPSGGGTRECWLEGSRSQCSTSLFADKILEDVELGIRPDHVRSLPLVAVEGVALVLLDPRGQRRR